jgi:hypothetical protein
VEYDKTLSNNERRVGRLAHPIATVSFDSAKPILATNEQELTRVKRRKVRKKVKKSKVQFK